MIMGLQGRRMIICDYCHEAVFYGDLNQEDFLYTAVSILGLEVLY